MGREQGFRWRISSAVQMVALGLCGLLMMMAGAWQIFSDARAWGLILAACQLDVGHVAVVGKLPVRDGGTVMARPAVVRAASSS